MAKITTVEYYRNEETNRWRKYSSSTENIPETTVVEDFRYAVSILYPDQFLTDRQNVTFDVNKNIATFTRETAGKKVVKTIHE